VGGSDLGLGVSPVESNRAVPEDYEPLIERRRHPITPDMQREVQRAVKAALSEHFSLVKNGDSWGQFLKRVFTVERVALVLLSVISGAYFFGMQVRDYQAFRVSATEVAQQTKDIADREGEILAQYAKLLTAVETGAKVTQQQQASIDEIFRLVDEGGKSRALIDARVRLGVTRAEWASAMRDIGARLDKIDQALR